MTPEEKQLRHEKAVERAEGYIRHLVPRLSCRDALILLMAGDVDAAERLTSENEDSYDRALQIAALRKAELDISP